MSEIVDKIREYRSGELTLQELTEFFRNFRFRSVQDGWDELQAERPDLSLEEIKQAISWGVIDKPYTGGENSWVEVYGAWKSGELTDDEYWTVHKSLFG